ncbi:MAG TPA: hypothetical protein VG916_04830 [Gemmatimonadaceae bacterium]|nr:hypothetical protein [Gemmatimonadaceae bacterium]
MTDRNDRLTMTCGEFEPLVQDYLEHDLDRATRDRMDAHRLGCAACDALVRDLLEIVTRAAQLDAVELAPARDLWAGVASRIQAEVVPIPTPVNGVPAARSAARPAARPAAWRGLAAAAVLVAVTATVTWTVATRTAPTTLAAASDTGFAAAMDLTRNVRLAGSPTLDQTYDREIAALRQLVAERRSELDSATVAALDKNLAIIDQAIAACKAALAQSPQSSFLLGRLTDAYDSKLRVLRAVAGVPLRG